MQRIFFHRIFVNSLLLQLFWLSASHAQQGGFIISDSSEIKHYLVTELSCYSFPELSLIIPDDSLADEYDEMRFVFGLCSVNNTVTEVLDTLEISVEKLQEVFTEYIPDYFTITLWNFKTENWNLQSATKKPFTRSGLAVCRNNKEIENEQQNNYTCFFANAEGFKDGLKKKTLYTYKLKLSKRALKKEKSLKKETETACLPNGEPFYTSPEEDMRFHNAVITYPDGEYLEKWANGSLKEKGNYMRNKKVGTWFYYADDTRRESVYIKDTVKVKVFERDTLFEEYVCLQANANKMGVYKQYFNGRMKELKTYSKNGDGKLDGPFKIYFDNGQLTYQAIFKNDIMDGAYASFHEDGTREEEGQYSKGQRSGKWLKYNWEGKLYKYVYYKDGEVVKEEDAR